MAETFVNPKDADIRALLRRVQRIAVVGLSPKEERASNHVASYLQSKGYVIVPVYPKGETILGQPVYRRLEQVPGEVDLVQVFRRSAELPSVFGAFMATNAPAIWLQLGCVDEAGAARAEEGGRTVVMDRCMMIEHRRLVDMHATSGSLRRS